MSVQLTKRQLEILELLAQGYTARQIGEELYLTEPTVKTHLQKIKGKFGVLHCNSARLVSLYREQQQTTDPLWQLVAQGATTGAVRDAAAVLLAHLIEQGVTVDEIARRMNRSSHFIAQLAKYGKSLRNTRPAALGPPG